MKNKILELEEKIYNKDNEFLSELLDILRATKKEMLEVIESTKYLKSFDKKERRDLLNETVETEALGWISLHILSYITGYSYHNVIKKEKKELKVLLKNLNKTSTTTENMKKLQWAMLLLKLKLLIKSELYKYFREEIVDNLLNEFEITKNSNIDKNQENVYNIIDKVYIDNKNYIDRIDEHYKKLENSFILILNKALYTDSYMQTLKKDVADLFNMNFKYLTMLLKTESHRIGSEFLKNNLLRNNVEYVKLVATLDEKTSNICRHLNNKIVKLQNAVVGVDLPPFHPNCRTIYYPFSFKAT